MEIHPIQYVRGEEHARAAAGNAAAPTCAWCEDVLGKVIRDPLAPNGARDVPEEKSGIVKCLMNVLIYDEEDGDAPPEEEERMCYFCSPDCASKAAAKAEKVGGISSRVLPENNRAVKEGWKRICIWCDVAFEPLWDGATFFYCSKCVEDGMSEHRSPEDDD